MEPSVSMAKVSATEVVHDVVHTFARPLIAVAMVVASVLCADRPTSPTPTRVRGTIEAVDGDVLTVKSRSGEDVSCT